MAKNHSRPTGERYPPQGLFGMRALYQHPPDMSLRIAVGSGAAAAVGIAHRNTQALSSPFKMVDLAITGASAAISRLKSIPILVMSDPITDITSLSDTPKEANPSILASPMPTLAVSFEII